jgi:uncharacterized protein YndB with AHSA1/START domain
MSVSDQDLGEVRRTGATVEIVFRRRYAKPIEKVWAALTVPARIADWFAPAEIDGDVIRVSFPGHGTVEGRIVVNEPMTAFAWTWANPDGSDSLVRFDLAPDGDGCRLTLTQSGLAADQGAGNAAGWHAHLDGLPGAIDGRHTSWERILEVEKQVNAIYKARTPA